jgi:hypothetical protein
LPVLGKETEEAKKYIRVNGRAYQKFKLGAFQRRLAATITQILYIYVAYTNSGVARFFLPVA